MNKMDRFKLCLVSSSGGHLTQLFMLKPFWLKHERYWVTFNKEDARSLLKNERVYHCCYPTNRNLIALIKNTFLAVRILKKERPDMIISTGAAVAVPFFYIAKCLQIKTVYIEVFDRIQKPTLTGRLVYPVANCFIIQWKELKKFYPKAKYLGSIF